MPEFEDYEIACADCKEPFVHTARDQEFYAEKQWDTPPKRCRPCRQKRKEQRDQRTPPGGGR